MTTGLLHLNAMVRHTWRDIGPLGAGLNPRCRINSTAGHLSHWIALLLLAFEGPPRCSDNATGILRVAKPGYGPDKALAEGFL